MNERFFVWRDEDDDVGDGAAAPMNDAEIDEYVRLYGHESATTARASSPTATASTAVIDLESDEEKEEKPFKADTKSETETEPRPSAASIQKALERFGHTTLRGLQEPALRSVFAGQDTIILLPTGGGKSLCFQLPAVMQPGLVVVISPLLALMQDQVVALRGRGIRVEMLCSLVSPKDKHLVHDRLARDAAFPGRSDRIEILYTTPETLPTDSLQATLKALDRRQLLALFAIDEAHCISSWGHDFLPSYLKLGRIRDSFPDVPIMALTATATDQVRKDIHEQLQLRKDTNELMGDFNRPNISYSVHNKDIMGDHVGALLAYIRRCHRGSVGIVYVHRRLDTETLVEELQKREDTIRFAPYHAQIPLKEREQILLDWLKGKIDVICAMIAFGMGIDHPALRFVVHWNMPKSMENLYQEAGRAGRDGHPSHHVLLYSREDYEAFQNILRMAEDEMLAKQHRGKRVSTKRIETLRERLKKLHNVMEWATKRECRRRNLLEHFGQKTTRAHCARTCDVCNADLLFEELRPLTSHRPEANTYHLELGEEPYKWRPRRSMVDDGSDGEYQPPLEAVPWYRGPADPVIPNFNLNVRASAPPPPTRRPVPTIATPSPVRPRQRRRTNPEPRIPDGVRSIADYIAATAHRRTTGRGWGTPSASEDENESESDDDVQWIDPQDVKREAPAPAMRPAKRPRAAPPDLIVIDDSD